MSMTLKVPYHWYRIDEPCQRQSKIATLGVTDNTRLSDAYTSAILRVIYITH